MSVVKQINKNITGDITKNNFYTFFFVQKDGKNLFSNKENTKGGVENIPHEH